MAGTAFSARAPAPVCPTDHQTLRPSLKAPLPLVCPQSVRRDGTHPMRFDDYQSQAARTALYPERGNNWMYPVLGLAGEAGEVAEQAKRIVRDDGGVLTPERRERLKGELGDVLWYVAALCHELGFEMAEVAEANLEKLASRQRRDALRGEGDGR